MIHQGDDTVTTELDQREDGELIGIILKAAHCRDFETMARTATEVSEMTRNWATHIPWDDLASLEGADDELAQVVADLTEMWEPAHLRNPVDPDEEYALDKNAYDFYRPAGRNLLTRTGDFYGWVQARRRTETWQYSRVLEAAPDSVAQITNDLGRRARGINFNSQDYLSFNTHPAIREAAAKAMHDYGPHSAGSPMVLGNTRISDDLEAALGDLVGLDHVTLFPTGWAAGFGAVVGLVRQSDHILIDRLAHSCLQQGHGRPPGTWSATSTSTSRRYAGT